MRKLIIEKAAVRANMAVIKERARGAALYGVLTGDGGGAGLTELARLIRAEGISRFAVGTVEEAQALREAGFEDEELLMLRATLYTLMSPPKSSGWKFRSDTVKHLLG